MSTGHSDCQPPEEAPGPDSAVPCALLALREWVTMPPSRDMRVAQEGVRLAGGVSASARGRPALSRAPGRPAPLWGPWARVGRVHPEGCPPGGHVRGRVPLLSRWRHVPAVRTRRRSVCSGRRIWGPARPWLSCHSAPGAAAPRTRQRRGFHTVKAGGWGSEKPTCVCEGVGPTQPHPAPPRGDTASHCPGLRTLSGRWARRRSTRHRSAGHVGERRAVLPRQARLSHRPAPGV